MASIDYKQIGTKTSNVIMRDVLLNGKLSDLRDLRECDLQHE